MKLFKAIVLLLVIHFEVFPAATYRWNPLLIPTYSLALLVGVVGGEIVGGALAGTVIGLDRFRMLLKERKPQTFLIFPNIHLPHDVKKLVGDYSKNIDALKGEFVDSELNRRTYKFSQCYSSFLYNVKNKGTISGIVEKGKFIPKRVTYIKTKVTDNRWTKRAVLAGFILAGVGIGCTQALKRV